MNIISEYVLEGLWKRLPFESVDWGKMLLTNDGVTIIQSLEGLNRTKRQRRGKFSFLLWGWPSSSALRHHSSSSQAFGLEDMTTSGPSALGLNLMTSSLGSPPCRRQIVGLLGLSNQWTNPYNKFPLVYIYMYPIGSVSLKHHDSYTHYPGLVRIGCSVIYLAET